MRTTFIISALALVVPAFSAPTVVPITKRAGSVKPGSYIVMFKDGEANDNLFAQLTSLLSQSGSSVAHDYRPLMSACAVDIKGGVLPLLQRMSGVESIEQDPIVSLMEYQVEDATFDLTPSEVPEHDHALFARTDNSGGASVDIYGIDTGIFTGHNCFGGRAKWGANFVTGSPDTDENGHGTHTAGTAVGKDYGVATAANIIAVKVLDATGSGANSNVIAGVNWAYQKYKETGRPSIATMSLGSLDPFLGYNNALNKAVGTAIAGGLHCTIAAGNSNLPTITSSPANVGEANTIGAVDSTNKKASFSNFGYLVDIWAPGVDIPSAWIDGPDSSKILSGTSMATPHVAGILAKMIDKYGNKSPQKLSQDLKDHAKPVVTGAFFSTNKLAAEW